MEGQAINLMEEELRGPAINSAPKKMRRSRREIVSKLLKRRRHRSVLVAPIDAPKPVRVDSTCSISFDETLQNPAVELTTDPLELSLPIYPILVATESSVAAPPTIRERNGEATDSIAENDEEPAMSGTPGKESDVHEVEVQFDRDPFIDPSNEVNNNTPKEPGILSRQFSKDGSKEKSDKQIVKLEPTKSVAPVIKSVLNNLDGVKPARRPVVEADPVTISKHPHETKDFVEPTTKTKTAVLVNKHTSDMKHKSIERAPGPSNYTDEVIVSATIFKKSRTTKAGIGFKRYLDGTFAVNRIVEDGLFSSTSLKVGDEVVSVNNISCTGLSTHEIEDIFKETKGSITVLAKRKTFTNDVPRGIELVGSDWYESGEVQIWQEEESKAAAPVYDDFTEVDAVVALKEATPPLKGMKGSKENNPEPLGKSAKMGLSSFFSTLIRSKGKPIPQSYTEPLCDSDSDETSFTRSTFSCSDTALSTASGGYSWHEELADDLLCLSLCDVDKTAIEHCSTKAFSRGNNLEETSIASSAHTGLGSF